MLDSGRIDESEECLKAQICDPRGATLKAGNWMDLSRLTSIAEGARLSAPSYYACSDRHKTSRSLRAAVARRKENEHVWPSLAPKIEPPGESTTATQHPANNG